LSKFFGVNPSVKDVPKTLPPHLLPNFKSNELIFNMEGKVKGGTLPALVERLTQHDVLDPEFMNAFLLTYKSFTTPHIVLDLIIQRFNIQPPPNLTPEEAHEFNEKKLIPIRLRVTNVLKTWVETYFEDFDDQKLFKNLSDFVNKDLKTHLKNPADQVHKLIQKKVSGTMARKMVFSGQVKIQKFNSLFPLFQKKAPLPIISKSLSSSKIKLIELDPLEIARQLTIMESRIFNQIQPSEFLGKAWSIGGPDKSPHIRELIERANKVTAWVVESILQEDSPKRRSEMTKHFVLIAEKSKTLNNFNTLMAILAGLSSAPIHRLKRTWAATNNKVKGAADGLRQLMDSSSNFARYRDALHSVNPPCVPFLGVYLTDLTFIEDGNTHLIKGTNLINFDKRSKVAAVIQEVQQYQTAQYCLQAVSVIEKYLLDRFKNVQSIDALYDLSLRVEPRESNDETVVKMIAENGIY